MTHACPRLLYLQGPSHARRRQSSSGSSIDTILSPNASSKSVHPSPGEVDEELKQGGGGEDDNIVTGA